MIAKTPEQIERLREAGKRMKQVVDAVLAAVRPGVPSMELERIAREKTVELGAKPSYLGYKSGRKGEKYPSALCVSINNEIAHCPPKPEKILQSGDVVALDFGLEYQGAFMDTAYTVAIGAVDKKAENLIEGTRQALDAGIGAATAGGRTGDIGAAVEAVAKQYKLGIVKDLMGHGVGAAVHEPPNIKNFGRAGEGELLVEGMVVALEPIFAEKSGAMVDDMSDPFGYITHDGSRAAHFEHTILITKEGAEVLTA